MASAILPAVLASHEAGLAWRRSAPVTTPQSIRDDPLVVLRRAEDRYADPGYVEAHSAELWRASRQVLLANPLNALAMRQLGILAEIKRAGNGKAEFALAERITRRDLPSQFALIDRAAQDGDLAGTLARYDHALLVRPEAGSQLFPVLSRAIADGEVRAGLRRYAGRSWLAEFLTAALGHGAEAASLAALLGDLRGHVPAAATQPAASRLLARLVEIGDYAAARDLVGAIDGGSADALEKIGFTEATADPRVAPLSWSIRNEDAVEAETGAGALTIRVAPERSALVAERTTLLAPGRYTLVQHLQYGADAPPAGLEWLVTCAGGSGPALLQSRPEPESGPPAQTWPIAVPIGCGAQKWQLRASSATSQQASVAKIARLELVKG